MVYYRWGRKKFCWARKSNETWRKNGWILVSLWYINGDFEGLKDALRHYSPDEVFLMKKDAEESKSLC